MAATKLALGVDELVHEDLAIDDPDLEAGRKQGDVVAGDGEVKPTSAPRKTCGARMVPMSFKLLNRIPTEFATAMRIKAIGWALNSLSLESATDAGAACPWTMHCVFSAFADGLTNS